MLVAGPILIPLFHEGSNHSHVIILGLMEPFTQKLLLGNTLDIYSLSNNYSDQYVSLLVRDYSQRVLDQNGVSMGTKLYDHMGALYLIDWVKNFPADIVTRTYSCISQILIPISSMPDRGLNLLGENILGEIFLSIVSYIPITTIT